MKLLLDTCTLLWWWSQPESLSPRSIALIKDPENMIRVSAASAWEIATKYRIGKYPKGGKIIRDWFERLETDRFQELSITSFHALKAGGMSGEHRDPFDRMIAAQSIVDGLSVVSPDTVFSSFGAERIW